MTDLANILFPCAEHHSLASAKQAAATALPPGSVGMVPRFPDCTGRGSLEDDELFKCAAAAFLTANEVA